MFYTYDAQAERLQIHDWEKLLIADGFDPDLFTKRHQDCPLCGSVKGFRAGYIGGDKWRWVCKECTSSKYESAYEFMCRYYGYQAPSQLFKHIYEKTLANESGIKKALAAPRHKEENTAESIEKSLRTTSFLWSKSRSVQEGDAVWKYLNRRIPGIQQIPDDIHYATAQYWEMDESGKSHHRGDYDAMVVRGFSPCGQLVQMHTTYLTPEGAKAGVSNVKKIRPGCGFSSFAFRIGVPKNGVLGLCEGIETAIAASLLHGVPVWPCHSASVLENFQVPADMVDAVKRIIIFADNDRSKVGGGIRNTGMLAAQALAKRLRKEGYRVLIMVTGKVGDFNDHYNDLRHAQVTCDAPGAAAPEVSQEPFERKFRNFG